MTAQLVDVTTSAPVRPRLTAVGAPVRQVPLVAEGAFDRAVVRRPSDAAEAAWVVAAVARVRAAGVAPDLGAEWAQPLRSPAASTVVDPVATSEESRAWGEAAQWQLTTRGLAVAVGLTVMVAVVMLMTMVSAFLAVDDAPPTPAGSGLTLVADHGPARP